ncbi:ethanolamine permease [Hymenobacter sp. BT186]|uniref:Ethanolamine permease n=1 Tax=Hymenobacter telluris TaxID=2816474 RepID=A0A939JCY7_9BACT|nr:ethanolamine permease [Hymenobacter telluris]MBO0358348.1 ethanolamine permease [Hymenobacter telluris]MBW3374374.1 ethanolamine permease [Hymenobacter norwichensis]
MNDAAPPVLKKVLKPLHLWAIAVGLVISGEYFGWNYGWAVSGTVGFLVATLLITVLYVTFIFSFTELTTAIPHAGGPFAYAHRALGPVGGFVAGYATLVEFLFAPPAIAFALGSYVHFLYPPVPVLATALGSYVLFIGINLLGIKESAMFSLVVTLLAVAELLLFMGLVAPHFKASNFLLDPMPFGVAGVFAALPFAIWFYLAIEGVAMVAEEVENPRRTIPIGYTYGLLTLVFLALGAMVLTGGVTNWHRLSTIDYPLPEALSYALGKGNPWTKAFASIGLFGLIASFHGTIIGYSRQVFALARAGYLPRFLARVNPRFQTPHWALVAGGVVGCISLLTGTTDKLIVLSVLGAVLMYLVSLLSLFVLRRKEPELVRPFVTPFYPWFPLIATVLSVVSLGAIVYYNWLLSLVFFVSLGVLLGLYLALGLNKVEAEVAAPK